ncbi:hypothetical protein [Actinorugispora endophytica]|uniref:Serine/threonine protein kinase n=1 Tax=Actinorugispora endophytica TaxID=1605990 RepID=A0A4R6V3X5_9ACTN|nr:hypothetical protein [Actinorugispora endophytica]TDQ54991.1 serine/threonine protein kinase [Actinorugispora endophytica]
MTAGEHTPDVPGHRITGAVTTGRPGLFHARAERTGAAVLVRVPRGAQDPDAPYSVVGEEPPDSYAVLLGREGALAADHVVEVGLEVAAELEPLHEAGMAHDLISPRTLLMRGPGAELAATRGPALSAGDAFSPLVLGRESVEHLPPEAFDGGRATPRSDVYRLASTLWTLLAGRAPYSRAPGEYVSFEAYRERVAGSEGPGAPRTGLPRGLDRVLRVAMARVPADRYPDARAFASALAAVRDGMSEDDAPDRPGPVASTGLPAAPEPPDPVRDDVVEEEAWTGAGSGFPGDTVVPEPEPEPVVVEPDVPEPLDAPGPVRDDVVEEAWTGARSGLPGDTVVPEPEPVVVEPDVPEPLDAPEPEPEPEPEPVGLESTEPEPVAPEPAAPEPEPEPEPEPGPVEPPEQRPEEQPVAPAPEPAASPTSPVPAGTRTAEPEEEAASEAADGSQAAPDGPSEAERDHVEAAETSAAVEPERETGAASEGADSGAPVSVREPDGVARPLTAPFGTAARTRAAAPDPVGEALFAAVPDAGRTGRGKPHAAPAVERVAKDPDAGAGAPRAAADTGERSGFGRMVVAATLAASIVIAVVGTVALVTAWLVLPGGGSGPAAPTAPTAPPSLATLPSEASQNPRWTPTEVRIVADDQETLTLAWTDNSQGRASYHVVGGPVGTAPGTLAQGEPMTTRMEISGLNPAFDYCFTVVAVVSVDEVAPSENVCTDRFRGV